MSFFDKLKYEAANFISAGGYVEATHVGYKASIVAVIEAINNGITDETMQKQIATIAFNNTWHAFVNQLYHIVLPSGSLGG